jgi:hypothetical protein
MARTALRMNFNHHSHGPRESAPRRTGINK